jgi:hypothetical protein
VRRLLASLLLLLTGLLPVQPLLADAVSAKNLPACCRRMGAHHCMMRDLAFLASSSSNTPRHFQAQVDPCPWRFVRAGSVAPLSTVPLTSQGHAFTAFLISMARPSPSSDAHLLLCPARAPPGQFC